MGWNRKVLRVNLTEGTCTEEPLNMQWADEYLGSRGLATKYLVSEIDPKVDPLSPDNKMIMSTGPLTGTMASTGGRYTVVTKGPLTGAIACSNSGGFFGAEMKFAGWDMIIFEGRSPKPVYLYVENDKAELRTPPTCGARAAGRPRRSIKDRSRIRWSAFPPSAWPARTRCSIACIVNDLHRAAGRSGVGAVMGSKNLKAVAIRGTKGVSGIKDFGPS
jgi:aldehyde:ferredoxin oxidoreductase